MKKKIFDKYRYCGNVNNYYIIVNNEYENIIFECESVNLRITKNI